MVLRFDRKEEFTEHLQDYMSGFSPDDTIDVDWCLCAPGMEGRFYSIKMGEGVSVSIVDATISDALQFRSRTSQNGLIEIGVNLEGFMESKIHGYRSTVDGYPGQSYISKVDGEMHMDSMIYPETKLKRIEVHFNRETFDDTCLNSGCPLAGCLKSFMSPKQNGFDYCSTILPLSQDRIIEEIISALKDSEKVILKDLCLELSQGILIHLSKGLQCSGSILSSKDIEKIRLARSFLVEDLISPPSLKDMAALVGLNDYKLKTGFRQAFGTTYHKTLTELRLEKARRLLYSRNRSVSEVALSVGYGNIGDFGIAFKKRYGLSPSSILKGAS